MEITPVDPSVGINAETGGTIVGWAHVEQSLRDIFWTRFGERIMREWYGSFVPALLGRNLTAAEVTPVFAAIASAIEVWEPRFRVTDLVPTRATREGELHIYIAGEFRPRALFGDYTAEGARRVELVIGAEGLRAERRRTQ
jgi:phage baseplate assembly protein W